MSTAIVEHDGLLYPCTEECDGRPVCGYCGLAAIPLRAGAECPMCASELVVLGLAPRRSLRALALLAPILTTLRRACRSPFPRVPPKGEADESSVAREGTPTPARQAPAPHTLHPLTPYPEAPHA